MRHLVHFVYHPRPCGVLYQRGFAPGRITAPRAVQLSVLEERIDEDLQKRRKSLYLPWDERCRLMRERQAS
jgi:hypothetical protein